jgi:hypothetical protein
MTYYGYIEGGQVVFDSLPGLAEGTKVAITVVEKQATSEETSPRSLYERMKPIIGIAKDLPPDASLRIDEILYGPNEE